jgi:hypothetical protein
MDGWTRLNDDDAPDRCPKPFNPQRNCFVQQLS